METDAGFELVRLCFQREPNESSYESSIRAGLPLFTQPALTMTHALPLRPDLGPATPPQGPPFGGLDLESLDDLAGKISQDESFR